MSVRGKSFIIAFLVVAVWGSVYPITRHLMLQGIPSFVMGFLRSSVSALAIFLILCSQKKRPTWAVFCRYARFLLPMAFLGSALMYACIGWGMVYVPGGKASLLNSVNPILIVLLSRVILKEPLTKKVIGLLMATVGILLVMLANNPDVWNDFSFRAVDLILITSGLGWAVYTVIGRLLGQRVYFFEVSFWVFFLGALMLLPFAFVDLPSVAAIAPTDILWFFYLGIFAGGMGYAGWHYGTVNLGAGTVGIINSCLPLFGVFFAWVFLHEQLTVLQLAGALVLVAGVCIAITAGGKEQKTAAGRLMQKQKSV